LSSGSCHYEVHGRQANSWTVQRVCDDRQSAIESAGSLFKELSLKAVKVLEVSYGSDEPVYHDKEVFFNGERKQVSKAPDVDLIGPVCQKVSEFYLPEARRSILTLLHKPLAGWKITPLELLYHAEHLQKLNDTGQILQGAVQRVAISQIHKTGQKVSERVLELYSMCNELLQDLKTRRHEGEFISLENDDLNELLKKAKAAENPTLVFMLALAQYLKSISTLDQKFDKILEFITDNEDHEVLGFLDQYLADFLFSSGNIKKIMGDEENLGDGLLGLINLIRAETKPSAENHHTLQRINQLIGEGLLPETKKLLVFKVKAALKGNASFVKGDPYESALFHRRILSRLNVDENTHIGGSDCVDAVQERCSRMTGSTSIAEILTGLNNPLDRVERLIRVANGMVGSANIRAICNYIIPVLESTHNTQVILEESLDDLKLLKKLSALQQKIRDADFQDYYYDKIMSGLDNIGMEAFKAKKIQSQLTSANPNKIQLGFSVLGLIAEDSVPYPNVMNLVRAFAKQTIMSAEFMGELEQKAKKGGEEADMIKEFYLLLEGSLARK